MALSLELCAGLVLLVVEARASALLADAFPARLVLVLVKACAVALLAMRV